MQYLRLLQDNIANIKRASAKALIVLSGQLARGLLSFVAAAIIARSTGAETFGEFTLFTTVFIIVSEIPNALDITYIKHANTVGSEHESGVYLLQALLTKCLYVLIACLLAWFVLPVASSLQFIRNEHTEDVIHHAICSGAIFSIYSTLLASFQQRHEFLRLSILRPVFHGIFLVIFMIFFMNNTSLEIFDITDIYFGVALFLSIISVLIVLVRNKEHIKYISSNFYEFIRVGIILTGSSTIYLVSSRLDVFFLTEFLDYEELGYYGVAIRISVIVFMMTGMLSTILTPKAPRAYASIEELKRYMGLSSFYVVIQVVLGVIVIVYMDELIYVFFGKEFIEASFISSILICQAIVGALLIPFQSLIQVSSKPSLHLYLSLIRALVALVLLAYLVPEYGLLGAATGMLVMTIIMVALTIYTFYYMWHKSGSGGKL